MLAGVGFEDEVFDFMFCGFIDELFNEFEATVVGVEGDVGVAFESFLIDPGPRFIDIREVCDY